MAAKVAVCRWQTVEDGPPRDGVDRWIKQDEASGTEHVLVAVPVRHPRTYGLMARQVVIRGSRAMGMFDGELTAALEVYEPPSHEDGA